MSFRLSLHLYYYNVSCSCMTTVASAITATVTRPAALRSFMTPRNFFFVFIVRFWADLGLVCFRLVWLVWKMGRKDHGNIRMDLFRSAMRCDAIDGFYLIYGFW